MTHLLSFLGILSFSFVLGLSGAMAPGPLLTVTITETARRGFMACLLLMIGHALLEFGIVIAFIFGLQHLLAYYGVALVISLLGGGFLLWMGYGIIAGVFKGQINLDFSRKDESHSGMNPIRAGILISLSNPYWFLWWVLIGGTYLMEARSIGFPAMIAFYIGHISSDFIWYSLVGALVAFGLTFGRKLQVMNRFYRSIMVACALFLVFLGFRFLNVGVKIARTHKVPAFKIERHLNPQKVDSLVQYTSNGLNFKTIFLHLKNAIKKA